MTLLSRSKQLIGDIVYLRPGAISLLKNWYVNWMEITINTLIGRTITRAILRNKPTLQIERTNVMTLVGLAKLFMVGWDILNVGNGTIVIFNRNANITLKFRTTTRTDAETIVTTFSNRVYGTNFKDKIVLDIGMYLGDSSVYFAREGASIVYGLEPMLESFQIAKENISLNKLETKVIPLNLALSSTVGKALLELSTTNPNEDSMTSSKIQRWTAFDTKIEVKTITLDALMHQFGLQRLNFLKMNCEGCEYEVIRTSSRETLSMIDEMYICLHSDPREILDKLSECGFKTEMYERNVVRARRQ